MVSPVYESYEMTNTPPQKKIIDEFSPKLKYTQRADIDKVVTNGHKSSTGRVNQIFLSMRIVCIILGRFPFSLKTENKWAGGKAGGKYVKSAYIASLKSPHWIYFGISSTLLLLMLILSMGGFLDVFLGWSFLSIRRWTAEQENLFQLNLIPFVLVWSCLLHTSVGNISLFLNRKNVVKFLNYWNFAVDKMEVEVPQSLKKILIMANIWFLGFLIVLIFATKVVLFQVQLAKGGSALMGIIALRTFFPKIDDISQDESWEITLGLIIIVYAMYASRALLFIFLFKCRLLRHCFKQWNLRLKRELKKPPASVNESDPGELQTEKADCSKIFADHVILLKLVRLTDKVFAAILLSYYGSQILNMCFELYYVTMSGLLKTKSQDGLDTFVAILLLMQNIYVFLSVSLHAAYVGEEANKGFEIIKREGIKVHDSPYKRHLLQSLQISFQQRIGLTGGHYFVIDKPFIVTVIGAVFTYFIIILQYYGRRLSPGMDQNVSESNTSQMFSF